jgi:chromosome segregation protein
MKIRRLEIQGFKSFADRTTFQFGDGITAIVGPNGCGKSNVVDAVKWALGDMSAKSLRGKRMEDVIFAGSATRKPSGLAEVTIVFDNTDGGLASEHTEVAVTRRLHRSGESEYLLNGDAGRLKDVRELFLDTGLGVEGQSIMEQGQIDALLRANSVDRRGLFEEAAGVSRYKQRKKEAESRLEKTGENLERLRDVLELEEKRLRALKVQAGRARRFRELSDELRSKKVLSAVIRWRAVAAERDALESAVGEARAREEAAAVELASFETEASRREGDREAAKGRVHELETRVAAAASDARAAADRAEFVRRTIEDLSSRVQAARQAAEAAVAQAEALAADAKAADDDAAGAAAREAAVARDLAIVEERLRDLEKRAATARAARDAAKAAVLDVLSRASRARNEETERRTEARQAQARLDRLRVQRAEARERLAAVEGEAAELAALAVQMDAEAAGAAKSLAAADEARAAAEAEAAAAESRRARVSEDRAKASERLDVLRRLAAAYEGVETGARQVLEEAANRGPSSGVVGLLADLVEATTPGAHALDRLLGHAAGAVVVRTVEDALTWLSWLREQGPAKARFLALDLVRGSPAPLPPEVGTLGGDPALLALIASAADGAMLVPDLAAGIAAWRASPAGRNAVTASGDRVTASGALVGGFSGTALGLVERSAEVKRLAEEVRALSARLAAEESAVEKARAAGRAAEADLRRLRAEIAARAEVRSRHGASLARSERERAHLSEASAQAEREAAEQAAALSSAEAGAASAATTAGRLEGERLALEAKAEESMSGFAALEQSIQEETERRLQARLAMADAKSRADAARERADGVRREASRLREAAEAARVEAGGLAARIAAADAEVAEAEATRKDREAARRRDGEALVAARKAVEDLERALVESRSKATEVQALHERLRTEHEDLRRREGEHRVRIEALVEQVRQEHGVDLAEAAAAAAESGDLPALETEIGEIRRRIEDLGNVNLNAIAELEEAEGRVGFLQAQEKDLLEAKAGLEEAITKLDEASVTRFQETFEAVREHFRETFRRLFGGGRAEILLEDPSDLLGSGIDIVARPPGKEQRTISLLSGGERTLTAVALLFAVFKAKPSPFAILDEVDAALDEANIRRVVALVNEFTATSQFLVVTHAKTTMEAAGLLYGVTMEEPGVSKRVAVRLAEETSPEPVAATA